MSTVAEIVAAMDRLPAVERQRLFAHLNEANHPFTVKAVAERLVNNDDYLPIEGLPEDLSIDTKQKVRALLMTRHAADR